MATRIERILELARVSLADKQKQRWSDSDLLLILDEGHKDFCRQTQLLHGRTEVLLEVGNPYITLPEDCWLLTRVEYAGVSIPFTTTTKLDHQPVRRGNDFDYYSSTDWESDVGRPEALIYDRRNLGEARLYPIPDETIYDVRYTFSTPAPAFVGAELLGEVTGVDDYTLSSDFGVVTGFFEPGVNDYFSSDFGVVVEGAATDDQLIVWYIRNPAEVAAVSDDLDTPAMFDTALKYYVVGQAYLNDINEEYQAKGAQQLAFYQRELDIANKTQQRDGTRAAVHETSYRRGI